MKILLTVLFLMLIQSNLFADEFRIFKRTSDGRVEVMQKAGDGSWPRTADEDFIKTYGQLESYELVLSQNYPENTKLTNIVNGQVVFTPYTQEEIDNFPSNKKKKDKDDAKESLKSANSVAELKASLKTLLDVE